VLKNLNEWVFQSHKHTAIEGKIFHNPSGYFEHVLIFNKKVNRSY